MFKTLAKVVLADTYQLLASSKASETWIIDSACCRNICNQSDTFKSITQEEGNIQVENREFVILNGVGNVALKHVSAEKYSK